MQAPAHHISQRRSVQITWAIAAVTATLLAQQAVAVMYPEKPIRMIVAVPPAGPADTLSRLISPKLTDALGQTIVIDNRAGANGNIAYEMTARAVPDGYTITAVAAGVAINPSLYRDVKFDPVRDFAAITQGISVPNILVVHPAVAATSVKELIALASRVEQVRAECNRYIDDRASELAREIPGVPVPVLRMQIEAGFRNCPCAAILHKHAKETQQ